jgi:hypothetical protein
VNQSVAKSVVALNLASWNELHLGMNRAAQSFHMFFLNQSSFLKVISNYSTIFSIQGGDSIGPISLSGYNMKELSTFITQFGPPNRRSLFPVLFLILQEPRDVFFENILELSPRSVE